MLTDTTSTIDAGTQLLTAYLGVDGARDLLTAMALYGLLCLACIVRRPQRHILGTAPVAFGLNWRDRGRKQTHSGERHLYEAPPTEAFWAAWRGNKARLKEAGYGASLVGGAWVAAFWERPSAEEIAAKAAAAAEAREASRAVDAAVDLPVPEGLSYLGYQRAGIAYAMRRTAALIGDEMGLGKTIKGLGIANAMAAKRVLIVCPASLKLNWSREGAKWLVAKLPIHVVRPGKPFPAVGNEGVVIVNYDLLHKHSDTIRAVEWDLLICDEAHALKSKTARRTKQVFGCAAQGNSPAVTPIRATRRLLLTGTPISNRPVELHPLLAYLDPAVWGHFFSYAKRYCNATQGRHGWDFSGASNLDELQDRLRETVMVRRLKAEVLTDLPAKTRQIVPLDVEDRALAALLKRQNEAYDRSEAAKAKARAAMHAAYRTGDNEAYRRAAAELQAAQTTAFSELSALRREVGVAKIGQVVEHLGGIEQPVVVFAHHKEVVAGIMAAMAEVGRTAVSVTGDMDTDARQVSVDAFQDGRADIIVGTLGAMSTGLTLTRSSHVVFAELDWVPATLSQAEDRCHRIGQHDAVLVQHLVFDGSLDARMVQVVVAKQGVITAALDAEHAPREAVAIEDAPVLSDEDLRAMEAAAAEAIAEREAWIAAREAKRVAAAEAEAARLREDEEASEEVLARLRRTLQDRAWLLGDRGTEIAEGLVVHVVLPPGQRRLAQDLLGRFEEGFTQTASRIRAAAVEEAALARAADPAVRAACLDACREISRWDMDRATEDNGIGWSATTTRSGHWLADQGELSEKEAAFALGILRIHRMQVPEPLHPTLFG